MPQEVTLSGATPVTARPKKRVPFWDNARFACITLVVMGHATQRLTSESDPALVVYLFLYAFHMPAFAIVSGFFSKSSPPGRRQMRRVITDILVPYLIMEGIWSLVQFLVEGKRELNPTQPSWTLWFLLALGIFRLILPYLALLRWPLLWSVVISVGVGYLDNVDSTFSLSRALGILPFFVLGWQINRWRLVDRWHLVRAKTWWVRLAAAAVLVGWAVVLIVGIDLWRRIDLRYWFFYDRGYAALGNEDWTGGLVRLAAILLAVVLTAAFFVLVPRSQSWITKYGQSTMYVYLLHSFVLYPLRESGILKDTFNPEIVLVGMLVLSVLIVIVLSSSPVRRIFRPLIEPRASWIFSRKRAFDPVAPHDDPTGSRRDVRT
ncbi:MAG TPA: acyltransferase family protein [Plantibacter sp.]|uniref:acyltransferase family protein n=1 Tax=Plantibacter sp. TaxID=1871045 RepID=UPI002C5C325A|nr:acyltransferase family protein [Plantibacter sp.]